MEHTHVHVHVHVTYCSTRRQLKVNMTALVAVRLFIHRRVYVKTVYLLVHVDATTCTCTLAIDQSQ